MPNTLLFRKLSKKGFIPNHIAEVGVYHPETSNIYDYIFKGVKCTLVEPDPKSIELIKNHFEGLTNVMLHETAIYDYNGTIELVQRRASTFISKLNSSPAIINDSYEVDDDDKFTVTCKTFDKIDDGTIDLLSIDIEGSEWFVLNKMISRPDVISLETHGAIYVNPYVKQILNWMRKNNYMLWYKNNNDSVFVKENSLKLTTADRFYLIVKYFHLLIRGIRKRLKKKLRL